MRDGSSNDEVLRKKAIVLSFSSTLFDKKEKPLETVLLSKPIDFLQEVEELVCHDLKSAITLFAFV